MYTLDIYSLIVLASCDCSLLAGSNTSEFSSCARDIVGRMIGAKNLGTQETTNCILASASTLFLLTPSDQEADVLVNLGIEGKRLESGDQTIDVVSQVDVPGLAGDKPQAVKCTVSTTS
jgi:hypothetical protein